MTDKYMYVDDIILFPITSCINRDEV